MTKTPKLIIVYILAGDHVEVPLERCSLVAHREEAVRRSQSRAQQVSNLVRNC